MKFILLIILFYISGYSNAQTVYGKLKIKTKFDKEYAMFWDRYILSNRDTSIYVYSSTNKTLIDSLPIGHYTLALNSTFNDMISQEVILKKKTKIKFSTKDYFQPYKDTQSFLDLMSIKDTIRIYYAQWYCFGGYSGYCKLIKDETAYKIIIFNEKDSLLSVNLNANDVKQLRNNGKYLPKSKRLYCFVPGKGGEYYALLNRKIYHKRSCVCYIYYLLTSKGLLKEN